ncbi:MAG: YwmB family TATA-box binding protein, partial [Clostridiales bacterium]|nr:YwmB family TATA-box binding protein [Clostridiales bacterium]
SIIVKYRSFAGQANPVRLRMTKMWGFHSNDKKREKCFFTQSDIKEEYIMKRHFLLGLILILFISFLYNTSAQDTKGSDVQEKMLLLEALETGGFRMEEFNINISTSIPNTFLTIKEIETMRKDIMGILDVDEKATIINMDEMRDSYHPHHQNYFEDSSDMGEETVLEQRTEDENYNEIITFIPNEDGNMTVIKLLSSQIVEQPEAHIMVDIVQNKGYKEIVGICNKVKDLLNNYHNGVETTVSLTGVHSGRLSKTEEKQKQSSIFRFLKARKIEVLEDEFFTSITAYSPLIGSHIRYGGKNVNIQLAMRYSEYEDKTYLWIATPLITTTY